MENPIFVQALLINNNTTNHYEIELLAFLGLESMIFHFCSQIKRKFISVIKLKNCLLEVEDNVI